MATLSVFTLLRAFQWQYWLRESATTLRYTCSANLIIKTELASEKGRNM